jgi:periplasmic protein TonB
VARPDLNGGRRRLGYFAAIFASALVHVGLVVVLLFVLPQFLRVSRRVEPPAYTVQVVDNLPAGDLGTHRLPPLSHRKKARREPPPEKTESQIIPPREHEPDPNAIALNERRNPTPTPTATPPPPPPEPTPTATQRPRRTARPTPRPTPRHHRERPTPRPTPVERTHRERSRPKAEPKPSVMVAKAEPTPDLKEELAKVHEQLEKQSKKTVPPRSNPEQADNGPAVASIGSSGAGYGVGPGSGSVGIQKDPEFLLYYETIRKRIKDAWSFPGANNELSTAVLFAIGSNGELTGVKILESSHDKAFDNSVVRAIRRAAPFPPPPEKYRSQFEQGVEAEFKPGELQS